MTMAGRANEGQGPGSNGRDSSYIDLATSDADEAWLARTRVFLSPIAAPSIMGLFGFAIATMMVGAWQAGWYGTAATPLVLWPLVLVVGGILQFIAAIACYRARDAVALAAHSVWGAFWTGWSILEILVSVHLMGPIAIGSVNQAFGFWFIGLGVVTMSAAFAAVAQSELMTFTLGTLAAGSALTAAGFWSGTLWTDRIGGWLFVASAAGAWLFATALMLEQAFGRTIIPLGKLKTDANIPGRKATRPIQREVGSPGVRVGQ